MKFLLAVVLIIVLTALASAFFEVLAADDESPATVSTSVTTIE